MLNHASPRRAAALLAFALALGCESPQTLTDAALPDAGLVADGGSDADDAGTATPSDPTEFVPSGRLSRPRDALTATLLRDGRVLLVGGEEVVTRTPLESVDIFDPTTGAFRTATSLPTPRAFHAAVLLQDGRVLVVGGGRAAPIGAGSGVDVLSSALLYDPARDAWEPTGSMLEARSHFGAVRLNDGRVLVVGGTAGTNIRGGMCTGAPDCGPLGDALASAEIYDPATRTFRATGAMRETRTLHRVERLADGRVVAIAGMDEQRQGFTSIEVFDPSTETWTGGPALTTGARVFHSSAVLPSGRLLVGGGKLPDTRILDSVQVVDVAGASQATAPLPIAVTLPVFVPLASGRVLSVGGFRCPSPCGPIAGADIFDESRGDWSPIGPLATARAGHAAVRLLDGRVLVCGGFSASANLGSCEISSGE